MKSCLRAVLGVVVILNSITPSQVQAAPAPPLTSVRVAAVYTPNAGREEIGSGQLSTNRDHGGRYILFATVEIGYGRPVTASFNGVRAEQYDRERILGPNRTIIGWVRYWRVFTPVRSGSIQYTADSINGPARLSTRLWVR